MMTDPVNSPEVGFDTPAQAGMSQAQIQTPCLIVDLDAFERNVERMRVLCQQMAVALRVHGKMHKSADIARYQMQHGGACGICCQKISEAEAFVRAGIDDVLISNQLRDPHKIDRLARLAGVARIGVCVDDKANITELSDAALRHHSELDVLVEIECGAVRCGVEAGPAVVDLARAINTAPGLRFAGIQVYQGAAQHIPDFAARQRQAQATIDIAATAVQLLSRAGFSCDTVTGAGTGTFEFEGRSGVYTELQCGSYVFMDADYQRVLDQSGSPRSEFDNALFILTSVMSNARPGKAVCDAGLKVQSVDSGLPLIAGRSDVEYLSCSDEHGVISDPANVLQINEKLKLIPGHCDPTCNLHDWYVGVRNGLVEQLWPVTARGKFF